VSAAPRASSGLAAARTALVALLLLGLGLCLGPAGWADPVALLAFGAVVAPAAGVALGSARAEAPALLAPVVALALAVALAQGLGSRALPSPAAGAAAVAGLFGLGVALGQVLPQGGVARRAGIALALALLASGGPVLFGFAEDGQTLGRTHPGLARALLVAAPDGLVLEVAGLDWSHANPRVYATSGVEWLVRGPRGAGTGLALLALGAASAGVALALRRAHQRR